MFECALDRKSMGIHLLYNSLGMCIVCHCACVIFFNHASPCMAVVLMCKCVLNCTNMCMCGYIHIVCTRDCELSHVFSKGLPWLIPYILHF
mgnify:CR=1 FL=1